MWEAREQDLLISNYTDWSDLAAAAETTVKMGINKNVTWTKFPGRCSRVWGMTEHLLGAQSPKGSKDFWSCFCLQPNLPQSAESIRINLNVGCKFQEMWRYKPERRRGLESWTGVWECGLWCCRCVCFFFFFLSFFLNCEVLKYSFFSFDPLNAVSNADKMEHAYFCFSGE